MSFLSIDCSTEVGSIFVKTKYKSFIKILQSDKSSIDLLMKQILELLDKNDIEFDDISRIFVNQGPGNFSGLRGSLSTAKGISISKNLQLFGYNTFIWPCIKFFNKTNDIYSLTKFRERYFFKKFDKSLKSSSKIEEVSETEILKKYDSKFKVIPKNVAKNFNEKILNLKNLNIVELDHNDLEFLYLKGLLDKDLIKPLYLS